MNIAFTKSFIHEIDAEQAREEFLTGHNFDLIVENLIILEDTITQINEKFVVRILLGKPQMELELEG